MSEWPTGRLLGIASRLVEHAWFDALARLDLTHAGMIVLHLLDDGPATQASLAARARVEAQTMSRTVERLEREGYVERRSDPADRRRRVVERTPRGSEVFARTHHIERELFPELADLDGFRSTLLGIIHSSSDGRWVEQTGDER
jgi:DNA-binding MarR family transcriptional regulator